MKLYIFNSGYLDLKGKEYSFGGVDTYISMLIDVANEIGMEPIVYQYAEEDFSVELHNVTVVGVQVKENWRLTKKKRTVFKEIEKVFDDTQDTLIFATDYLAVKNTFKRVIAIQHGVAWDIKNEKNINQLKNRLNIFRAAIGSYVKLVRYSYCKTLVCVDYNFLNWYRTQVSYIPNKIKVIPNCADLTSVINKVQSNKVRIIFARRLCDYRGTRIFTHSITKILDKFDNIEVTIAGDGPDKVYMKEKLSKYSNVNFIKYSAKDSILIHSQHDIAVVPTIGSEGTSLSLLEAMASKCAVVCTNVGGMTNIIIDGYNGLMVNAEENEIYHAIEKLVEDKNFREQITLNGYETVKYGFNYEKWKDSWKDVLLNLLD